MWWTVVSLAAATPSGADSTCAVATVIGFRPADGSTVPPDVEVQVVFEGCGLGLQLLDEEDRPVETQQSFLTNRIVLTPFEPLPPGLYSITGYDYASYGNVYGSFTVATDAEPPAPPSEPLEVRVDAVRSCEGALTTEATVSVSFEPDPLGWGLVEVGLSTENGLQESVEELWYGQPTVEVSRGLFGGREVCATARMWTADGEEAWVGDPVCAEPFEGCPDLDERETEADDAGCGCASSPHGGWLLFAAAPLAARRRRSPQA